eukprot:Skav234216  [mRNA]  locus=scaffold1101:76671:78317:- [translate_table: standard]
MPGPWVQSEWNPGWLKDQHYEKGSLVEFVVYDGAGESQGKVLGEVKKASEATPDGKTLEMEFISIEDRHLYWWCRSGPGKDQEGKRVVHVCHGTSKKCKGFPRKKDSVFHTDIARTVSLSDVDRRLISWWFTGASKKDFEGARSRLLKGAKMDVEEEDGEMYPPEVDVDEFGLPISEEEEAPEKEKGVGSALAKKLDRLKKDASPKGAAHPKQKKPKGGEEVVKGTPAAKAGASTVEKRRKAGAEAEAPGGKPVKKRAKEAEQEAGWFGRTTGEEGGGAQPPSEEESSSSSRSEGKKAKKKSKKKKKKKSQKGDRGPFGSGRKVSYGKERRKKSESESDESEASFQAGAPEKRSHQLILMEYSDRRPGRLAARLLQKMQELTSRTGAPLTRGFPVAETKTPPVAVQYYHTVLFPQNRERMTLRLQRELRTLTQALDYAAVGDIERCSDLLGQRLKALELNMVDQSWSRAQFLELIPLEGAHLADTEEQRMATKEQVAEARVSQWLPNRKGGKGQPYEAERNPPKGKGKGKKGKTKREADPPAEKTPTA